MKLVLLNTGMNGYYLLSVPNGVAENIEKYKLEFDEWIRDENNDHGYWVEVDEEFGKFRALSYDGNDAFTKWLNDTVLRDSEEKAECLPRIDF